MERKQADKGPIIMACVLTIAVGAVYFITSVSGIFAILASDGIAVEEMGKAGLVAVLLLIGAAQIIAGVVGIMSFTREKLRPYIKWLGYAMLLMAVTYAVTTALIRGFQWGTVFSIALAVMYLAIVKPSDKKPLETKDLEQLNPEYEAFDQEAPHAEDQ